MKKEDDKDNKDMITRLQSLYIALGFLAGFIVCLSYDLYGVFAATSAVGLFLFLSAAVDQRTKRLRIIKRAFGLILVFAALVSPIGNSKQNFAFLITLGVCGILFLFDQLTLWLIRQHA